VHTSLDRLLQPLGDGLEEIDQRLLLASFEHRQHDGFSGPIVRADQGDKIGMSFEERDFIQSQETERLDLTPIDFALDVALEYAAHDIVGYTVLLRDILKGAVDELEQEKSREGLGTPKLGIVLIRALSGGHNALAIPATITLGAQAEDHGPTTQG
jgi:hypothetical protein